MKKLIIFLILFALFLCVIILKIYSVEDQANSENISQETMIKETLIEDKLKTLNEEHGYNLVSVTYPYNHQINTFSEVYADVIMEKEGMYDWLRIRILTENGRILLMEQIPIYYYEGLEKIERLPDDILNTVNNSMASIITEDRSLFGINLRSSSLGTKGISGLEVKEIEPIGSNKDLSRILVRVFIEIDIFERSLFKEHLVFLRKYEDRKWQIEHIEEIKGAA